MTAEQRASSKGMWAPPHKDPPECYVRFSRFLAMSRRGCSQRSREDTGLLTVLVPGVFLDQSGERLQQSPDPEVGLYVRDRTGFSPGVCTPLNKVGARHAWTVAETLCGRKGRIMQICMPAGVGEGLFFQVGEALQVVSGGHYHATEHLRFNRLQHTAGAM